MTGLKLKLFEVLSLYTGSKPLTITSAWLPFPLSNQLATKVPSEFSSTPSIISALNHKSKSEVTPPGPSVGEQ